MELLQEKAEEFIKELEAAKMQDRRHFDEVMDERDKEKRDYIN